MIMQKTILIIEDNPKNLKLMKLILGKTSYNVQDAKNGMEGVKKAKELIPDAIIMDIQMPIMNGTDAIKELKANDATRDIPIIAATAFAMKGDKEQFLKQGFTEYISKPISIDNFLDVVKKVLGDA